MKIVMPKMPDFSKMSVEELIDLKCRLIVRSAKCNPGVGCGGCALNNAESYKAWKAQQKKDTLIKWPISSKERFFVLPRTFVNYMPSRWKRRFLKLITEFYRDTERTKDNPFKFRVSVTKNGKYVKMPEIFKRR